MGGIGCHSNMLRGHRDGAACHSNALEVHTNMFSGNMGIVEGYSGMLVCHIVGLDDRVTS